MLAAVILLSLFTVSQNSIRELRVAVYNDAGEVVSGLNASDFIVEGPEAKLSVGAADDIPVDLAILIDRSAYMDGDELGEVLLRSAGIVARALLMERATDDGLALMSFSEDFRVDHEFDEGRQELEEALSRLRVGGRRRLAFAMEQAIAIMRARGAAAGALVVVTTVPTAAEVAQIRRIAESSEVPLYMVLIDARAPRYLYFHRYSRPGERYGDDSIRSTVPGSEMVGGTSVDWDDLPSDTRMEIADVITSTGGSLAILAGPWEERVEALGRFASALNSQLTTQYVIRYPVANSEPVGGLIRVRMRDRRLHLMVLEDVILPSPIGAQ